MVAGSYRQAVAELEGLRRRQDTAENQQQQQQQEATPNPLSAHPPAAVPYFAADARLPPIVKVRPPKQTPVTARSCS